MSTRPLRVSMPALPKVLCILVVWLVTTSVARAEEVSPSRPEVERLDGTSISIAEIERRIPELMEKVWLPGLNVAVVRDGAIEYLGSFGVRDARGPQPVDAETNFAALSWSKTLTAYLVLRLVEAGRLDLDRPLHAYLNKPLPEYEFYRDLEGDVRHKGITAAQVLSHTTGWPNWRWFTDEGTLHFLFPPGSRHSYSGEGFAYLQLALEELFGKSLEELMERQVFDPLGMRSTDMVWRPEFEDNYAEDHDFLGRQIDRPRRDEAQAAGSAQTTILDYARFVIGVMHSLGLDPDTRDRMLEPEVEIRHARMFGPRLYEETQEHVGSGLAWTLGWGRIATPYGPAIFHTGNDRGSANYAFVLPGQRAAVLLMGNSNRLEGIASELVALLAGDRSSPFDFLGYEPWNGPRQTWFRTLAQSGVAAGRAYWKKSVDSSEHSELNDDQAFEQAGEVVAHLRSVDEAIAFQRWRQGVFPESLQPARAVVKLLLGAERKSEVHAELDELKSVAGLEWFSDWARAVAARAASSEPVVLGLLAGEYGPRRFELRGKRLYYGRDATLPKDYAELIPQGEHSFVLEEIDFFRLRFERDPDGRGVRVLGLYEDGRVDTNERSD